MEHNHGGKSILRKALFTIAIFWTCTPGVSARFTPYARAISLNNVPSLVFQRWKLTNYRRNEPRYQLMCVSGCDFEPDWVKCFIVHLIIEKGPAWRCQADLPSHLQFSTLEVLCEGYESADDTNILEESCGLEYGLKHVVPNIDLKSTNLKPSNEVSEPESDLKWSGCKWLMLGTIIYVCCYCLYQVVQSDLKEAPNITHQKTAKVSFTGKCGKSQSTRFSLNSLPDLVKDKYHQELQGWQNDTPSQGGKLNEEGPSLCLDALSTTSNNQTRELNQSPHGSPCSPRGGFLKKLARPSRYRKREESDSPRA